MNKEMHTLLSTTGNTQEMEACFFGEDRACKIERIFLPQIYCYSDWNKRESLIEL